MAESAFRTLRLRDTESTKVLAILLALLPLVPGLWGGFVFDDFPNIVENPAFQSHLQSVSEWWQALFSLSASELGRPLSVLSFLVNAKLGGLNPFWFKLTNLALHGGNGMLLYLLMRALLETREAATAIGCAGLQPRRIALLLAVGWTLLSVHVSAVLMVVQRMEVLANLFVLLGLLSYVQGRRRLIDGERGAVARIGLGLLVLPALGTLAKESAALTPLYAFLLEVYLFRFAASNRRRQRALVAAFGGLAIVAGALAIVVLPGFVDSPVWGTRNFNLSERLLTEPRILWQYLRWIAAPDLGSMSLYHDGYVVSRGWLDPPSTALAVAAWGAVAGLLLYLARRPSLLGLGLAWFISAHLLTATVIPLELVFEHRNYFAATGILIAAMALALRAWRVHRLRRWIKVGVVLCLLSQALVSTLRAFEWADPLRLAISEAARNPQSPRANYDLGARLLAIANDDAANPYYRAAMQSFERAADLPGASAAPLQALLIGASKAQQSIPDVLWARLRARVHDGPMDPQTIAALQSLARCQIGGRCQFPQGELVSVFVAAVNRPTPNAEVLTTYAHLAQLNLHDAALSLELLQVAASVDSRNPIRWHQLGQALALAGRYQEALAAADEIDRLDRWQRYRTQSAAVRTLVENHRRLADPGH